MATSAATSLAFFARASRRQVPLLALRARPATTPSHPRTLSTTTLRLARAEDGEEDDLPARTAEVEPVDTPTLLRNALSRRSATTSTPRTPAASDEQLEELTTYVDSAVPDRTLADDLRRADEFQPPDAPLQREPKLVPGFFAMGEEGEDPGDDPEFDADDISSLAHAELEQLREQREYARVMAWDMPLLFQHAKPFTPPTASTPLRFRYTTYLGEAHPASRKVVLTFSPSSLPDLTPTQTSKLIKLLAARYNPSTNQAKMSCELHATPAQNKRHLAATLDALLRECRDPNADTFADVPFDFRHHKVKRVHVFPEGWKMTAERRGALEARRGEVARLEEARRAAGELVEGVGVIERALLGGAGGVRAQKERVPVMAAPGGGAKAAQKGKGKAARAA